MKRLFIDIVCIGCLALLFPSCSTQKNTQATRSFHQTKVKYNIFYNGNLAYEDGLRSISTANEDNYSTYLNLYPVSNHDAAKASESQMNKTIEKCRKCIKLHSIKSRPVPDPKRRNDPEYKRWLKQEEFNNQMGDVWIRLGEAEFHKGDFLGSVGTFTYVIRHYEYDPDIIARCQLWIARAYAEMGWLYEAEDMLKKVKVDDLNHKHSALYAATNADVLMKTKHYHEAIPFVKIATPNEKRTIYRPRFQYVLAQLYEAENKRQEASEAYTKVIRLAPPTVMDFNARIHRAQLQGKNSIRTLEKMAKQSKYKDNQDQIYGTIGDIYLSTKDTTKALQSYQLAIEKSTKNGMPKAAVLVTAGDIYYELRNYKDAQPCYREATTILPSTDERYARVQHRSETLDELIAQQEIVLLQDSLQYLSTLSEEEQRKVAEKIVEDLKAAEEKAEEDAKQAARDEELGGISSVDTRGMFGGGANSGEWYFYNAQLIKGGKQDFTKKWGNRPLEDNWRRRSKAANSSFVEIPSEQSLDSIPLDSVSSDSTQAQTKPKVNDPHDVEYYLQQIPKTQEDLALSDSMIEHALFEMVYIYRDKVEDFALADETLEELARRFPKSGLLVDLYYMKYLDALKTNDTLEAERYRQLIIANYPDSKQASIVAQPDYFERLQRMTAEQDSLYEQTYKAYKTNDFATVKANKQQAETDYPLSPLMPRFLFLNAVSVARTEGQDAFADQLRDLVKRYPESTLGTKAKDMLAMMGQGMESQQGASSSSLEELRGQSAEEETLSDTISDKTFSEEKRTPSVVIIAINETDEKVLNELQYQVALFNFSQFLVRDFDLFKMPAFGEGSALRIAGLESLDEAIWYMGMMQENAEVKAEIERLDARLIPITEENYPLIPTTYSEEEYADFLKKVCTFEK
ncbi:MAG: hypothetical protein MJZ92_01320 [Paludibacteraceae bacterium]|nr:hypothetical protein [Paludibacteraceae bacterium]